MGAAICFEEKRIALPARQKFPGLAMHDLRMLLAVDRASHHPRTIPDELKDAQVRFVLIDDDDLRRIALQQLPHAAEIGFVVRAC